MKRKVSLLFGVMMLFSVSFAKFDTEKLDLFRQTKEDGVSVLNYIPVQPNTTYTYSSMLSSSKQYNKRMVCFDANKNYITSIADTTGNPSGPFSITGTTPANTRYVRVACSDEQISN